jgi:hypothetical protein
MDGGKKSGGTCPLCAALYEEADILVEENVMKRLGRNS